MTPSYLYNLGLSAHEMNVLRRQGFVHAEQRGDRVLYKLRYRHLGKQRVRSLGSDAAFAAQISAELDSQQRPRHRELFAKRLAQAARHQLQDIKQRHRQRLLSEGLHFHGFAVRAFRKTQFDFDTSTMRSQIMESAVTAENTQPSLVDSTELFAARQAQARQMARQALQRPDLHDAAAEGLAADAVQVSNWVAAALADLLTTPPSIAELESAAPAIGVHTQTTRLAQQSLKHVEKRLQRRERREATEANSGTSPARTAQNVSNTKLEGNANIEPTSNSTSEPAWPEEA